MSTNMSIGPEVRHKQSFIEVFSRLFSDGLEKFDQRLVRLKNHSTDFEQEFLNDPVSCLKVLRDLHWNPAMDWQRCSDVFRVCKNAISRGEYVAILELIEIFNAVKLFKIEWIFDYSLVLNRFNAVYPILEATASKQLLDFVRVFVGLISNWNGENLQWQDTYRIAMIGVLKSYARFVCLNNTASIQSAGATSFEGLLQLSSGETAKQYLAASVIFSSAKVTDKELEWFDFIDNSIRKSSNDLFFERLFDSLINARQAFSFVQSMKQLTAGLLPLIQEGGSEYLVLDNFLKHISKESYSSYVFYKVLLWYYSSMAARRNLSAHASPIQLFFQQKLAVLEPQIAAISDGSRKNLDTAATVITGILTSQEERQSDRQQICLIMQELFIKEVVDDQTLKLLSGDSSMPSFLKSQSSIATWQTEWASLHTIWSHLTNGLYFATSRRIASSLELLITFRHASAHAIDLPEHVIDAGVFALNLDINTFLSYFLLTGQSLLCRVQELFADPKNNGTSWIQHFRKLTTTLPTFIERLQSYAKKRTDRLFFESIFSLLNELLVIHAALEQSNYNKSDNLYANISYFIISCLNFLYLLLANYSLYQELDTYLKKKSIARTEDISKHRAFLTSMHRSLSSAPTIRDFVRQIHSTISQNPRTNIEQKYLLMLSLLIAWFLNKNNSVSIPHIDPLVQPYVDMYWSLHKGEDTAFNPVALSILISHDALPGTPPSIALRLFLRHTLGQGDRNESVNYIWSAWQQPLLEIWRKFTADTDVSLAGAQRMLRATWIEGLECSVLQDGHSVILEEDQLISFSWLDDLFFEMARLKSLFDAKNEGLALDFFSAIQKPDEAKILGNMSYHRLQSLLGEMKTYADYQVSMKIDAIFGFLISIESGINWWSVMWSIRHVLNSLQDLVKTFSPDIWVYKTLYMKSCVAIRLSRHHYLIIKWRDFPWFLRFVHYQKYQWIESMAAPLSQYLQDVRDREHQALFDNAVMTSSRVVWLPDYNRYQDEFVRVLVKNSLLRDDGVLKEDVVLAMFNNSQTWLSSDLWADFESLKTSESRKRFSLFTICRIASDKWKRPFRWIWLWQEVIDKDLFIFDSQFVFLDILSSIFREESSLRHVNVSFKSEILRYNPQSATPEQKIKLAEDFFSWIGASDYSTIVLSALRKGQQNYKAANSVKLIWRAPNSAVVKSIYSQDAQRVAVMHLLKQHFFTRYLWPLAQANALTKGLREQIFPRLSEIQQSTTTSLETALHEKSPPSSMIDLVAKEALESILNVMKGVGFTLGEWVPQSVTGSKNDLFLFSAKAFCDDLYALIEAGAIDSKLSPRMGHFFETYSITSSWEFFKSLADLLPVSDYVLTKWRKLQQQMRWNRW